MVEPAVPAKRLKKEISDVSVDSEGYPKDLETPEKKTLPKGEKSSSCTLAKGDMLSHSTLAKGMVNKRRRLLRKRMGSRVLPMSSSLDAGLEHAFGFKRKGRARRQKPWHLARPKPWQKARPKPWQKASPKPWQKARPKPWQKEAQAVAANHLGGD